MIIPVRCFSCGRVIGSDYVRFTNKVEEIRKSKNREATSEEIAGILDDLNVTRYCCRRMILSNAELLEEILPFD
ncbi:MAG: DNA-directed RNA polymerase subunit N [Thermoplasmatales archaeon]|jgi:DNA-directed RNA polymerase subunit N|nr:DNA-directed RNA polymerase subunit N [Candidatus Thermoplasmatota archaeon]MCL6002600.1 DNA-directed RNA polymerase subunit N [Candidatus Thermoplasmatota archaeon]MDA8054583.1 DNA-directed RNA polymerase subunit N [Thermoplasmatales archaeon]